MKHNIIYRTTCIINSHEYTGKHETDCIDDDYLGSGKLIQRAIKKHGRNNFKREVLHDFETAEEMNAKEAELVTEEYCAREDTYNICPGGQGGWGYVNQNGLNLDLNNTLSKKKMWEARSKGGKKAAALGISAFYIRVAQKASLLSDKSMNKQRLKCECGYEGNPGVMGRHKKKCHHFLPIV